jgi:hypothetical protein
MIQIVPELRLGCCLIGKIKGKYDGTSGCLVEFLAWNRIILVVEVQ